MFFEILFCVPSSILVDTISIERDVPLYSTQVAVLKHVSCSVGHSHKISPNRMAFWFKEIAFNRLKGTSSFFWKWQNYWTWKVLQHNTESSEISFTVREIYRIELLLDWNRFCRRKVLYSKMKNRFFPVKVYLSKQPFTGHCWKSCHIHQLFFCWQKYWNTELLQHVDFQ